MFKSFNSSADFLKGFRSLIICSLFSLVGTGILYSQCETINLACNNQVNVSINEDCYAAVTADLILENPPLGIYPDDGQNYKITLQDKYGIPIVPSNQVSHKYVNQLIKASVELVPCGISCWGYILVEDKIGPKIWGCINGELPPIQIDCDEFSNGFEIPEPQLGSICPDKDFLSFIDDTSSLNCNLDYAISIIRKWKAEDIYGNKTTCNQLVQIRKLDLKNVVVPPDYVVTIDQEADCSVYLDISPDKTGYPTGIHCSNIMYSYSDIDYPQCGYQKKLLRDWFVIDWCTGQSFTKGQIIKYLDQSPPNVACTLDTVYVGNDNYLCGALPILNPFRVLGFDTLGAFQVLDTCPDVITLSVGFLPGIDGVVQPINVPYYNIPQDVDGTFKLPQVEDIGWIRYCFTDQCGNATIIPEDPNDAGKKGFCHYFKIKAVDNNPPTPICEGFTKVHLGEDGLIEVYAETFDDHSFDPCGDVSRFEVRREQSSCFGFVEHGTLGWGESIHFCCKDLGDTITIRLRVFDMAGNSSECLGLVCVSDSRIPDVVCPDAIVNLDCGDDYRNHSLTGVPTGENGCDAGFRLGPDMYDLKDYNIECGVGRIIRTLEVFDFSDRLLETCTQEIRFDADLISTQLENGDYDFPDNIVINICNSGGTLDPAYTGVPTSNKEFGCANIAISYKDDAPFVQNIFGQCYKILRRWKVVDWCNYHPSNPNAYILTGVQEITVTDSSIPIFSCPSNRTVVATGNNCFADVDLKISVASSCNSNFDVSWSVDLFSDGSINENGLGNNASGSYPVGEHTITYTGANQCGGTSNSCEFTFKIESNAPPIPICRGDLVWSIGSTGATEVWASDFDLKSEGRCGLDELIFSFVDANHPSFPELARTYRCSDLDDGKAKSIQVQVFIVDETGRSAACTSVLHLQDNLDVCPDMSGNIVGGAVHTEFLEPLENVMMELHNMQSEVSMMEMTSINGGFAFENVESTNSYELNPYLNEDHLNGISTLDLVFLQRHILGLEELNSPYKLIAGDVDNSGTISAIDLIHLRKLILGIYNELPENDSWAFVPENYKFTDPKSPWDYPRYLELSDMNNSRMDANFVAIKVGDINGSVEMSKSKKSNAKSMNSMFINTINNDFVAGELVAVPLIVERAELLLGLQFTLKFDDRKMLFEGIDNGMLKVSQDNFSLVNNYRGALTFSFDNIEGFELASGQTLFTIYFEARGNVNVSKDIKINSAVTSAEAYTSKGQIQNIELVARSVASQENKEMEVFQNEPNPFLDVTRITFSIPERQKVSLTVFDANGKTLYRTESEFGKGVNEFVIDSKTLDATGLLLYRIESGTSSITKKMILLK